MSSIGQSEILTRQRMTAFFQGELPTRHSGERTSPRTPIRGRNPVAQTGEAAPCSDIPGFCKAETVEGIQKHGFVLTLGRCPAHHIIFMYLDDWHMECTPLRHEAEYFCRRGILRHAKRNRPEDYFSPPNRGGAFAQADGVVGGAYRSRMLSPTS